MAILPQSLLRLKVDTYMVSAVQWVQGLLGANQFSPEESLAEAKHVDPRLVPKVPMQSGDIDANLLVELGKMGMRRGKLVSEESHPELMHSWKIMSARAGLKKAPQLIIVESDVVNAMTVTPEEVVITTGILKKLDFREVNAVLGHELAHANSDHKRPRIAANLIFSTLGAFALNKVWRNTDVFARHAASSSGTLVHDFASFMAGATLGGSVANHIAVKPTELQADLKGAAISGDPLGLVSALHKLESNHKKKPLLSFISEIFSGYPTTEQRIANLQTVAAHMPEVILPHCVTETGAQTACTQAPAPGSQVSSVMAAGARIEEVAAPSQAVG